MSRGAKESNMDLFHDLPCRIIDSSQMHLCEFLLTYLPFVVPRIVSDSLMQDSRDTVLIWRHTPVNLWKRYKSRLVEGGCFDANDKKWKLYHSIFTVSIQLCVCAGLLDMKLCSWVFKCIDLLRVRIEVLTDSDDGCDDGRAEPIEF